MFFRRPAHYQAIENHLSDIDNHHKNVTSKIYAIKAQVDLLKKEINNESPVLLKNLITENDLFLSYSDQLMSFQNRAEANRLIHENIQKLNEGIASLIQWEVAEINQLKHEISHSQNNLKVQINKYIEREKLENDALALTRLSALKHLMDAAKKLNPSKIGPAFKFNKIKNKCSRKIMDLPSTIKAKLKDDVYEIYEKNYLWLKSPTFLCKAGTVPLLLATGAAVTLALGAAFSFDLSTSLMFLGYMGVLVTPPLLYVFVSAIALSALLFTAALTTYLIYNYVKDENIQRNDPLFDNKDEDFNLHIWQDSEGNEKLRATYQLAPENPLQSFSENNEEVDNELELSRSVIDGITKYYGHGTEHQQHDEETLAEDETSSLVLGR